MMDHIYLTLGCPMETLSLAYGGGSLLELHLEHPGPLRDVSGAE